MHRLLTVAALTGSAAFAAFPALAGADRPDHPGAQGGQGHASKPPGEHGRSQRCKKPATARGYVVSGTYGDAGAYTAFVAATDASPATPGSVSFTVTHTNHQAKGATSPFAFADAKVTFDSPTATAPVATDTVTLIGKILVAKKGCTLEPTVNPVSIRKIVFASPSSAEQADSGGSNS